MCLIIASKTLIGRDIFDEAVRQNPDGLGLMYAWKGELILLRSFDKESIWEEYQCCIENELQTVLHFRFATKGVINLENCHPFRLNKDLAIMHNGSLDIPIYNQLMSDTWHYSKYLSNLAWHQIETLDREIGTNKLVFMNREGRVKILNKSFGQWNDSKTNWYSNSRVLETLYPVKYKKTTYSNWGSKTTYPSTQRFESGVKTQTHNSPIPSQQKLAEALLEGTPYYD